MASEMVDTGENAVAVATLVRLYSNVAVDVGVGGVFLAGGDHVDGVISRHILRCASGDSINIGGAPNSIDGISHL